MTAQQGRINPWRLFVGAMIPNWLLEREELSQGAKLAYARLSQFAGKKGYCWPKLDTIAASIGVKTRQAQSYIAELREHKLLDVHESTDGRSPNKFFFLDHSWMHDDVSGDPDDSEPEEDEPVFPGGAEDCTPGVQKTAPQGCSKLRTEENQGSGIKEESHEALAPLAQPPPEEQRKPGPVKRAVEPQVPRGFSKPNGKTLTAQPRWLSEQLPDPEPASEAPKPPERPKTPSEQSEAIRKAIEEQDARSKASAERAFQKIRSNEQSQENLKGKPSKYKSKHLESVWQELMTVRFPSLTIAPWGPKEFKQVGDLVEKYSGPIIDHALHYLVEQWDSIQARILKNKGSVPTVGFLLRFHDQLVPEAQCWIEYARLKKQVDEFFHQHPHAPYPPSELDAQYKQARQAVEGMGLRL